eukprot:TRINITY_DN35330_c0_g1_i1.p1 TRINITY_DN35330_c0_g1~~TRINITY_DN35330_c0_g1_i1.p1  ORF type:complete len:350 (+),score=60.50 TRINITY_DN35330_c0_g1_i1:108-1157(+)
MFFQSCLCEPRRRTRTTSEEAILPFAQHMFSKSDMFLGVYSMDESTAKMEAKQSLQQTLHRLRQESPDSVNDMVRTRTRTNTDLVEYVSALDKHGSESHERYLPSDVTKLLEAAPEPTPSSPSAAAEVRTFQGFADHEELTKEIYRKQGLDFEAAKSSANAFLSAMGLRAHDSGVRNQDDEGRVLWNQCFYLSLARAYLGHQVEDRQRSGLALLFKRAIEAAVLAEHPSWGEGLRSSVSGEGQAMVFADFIHLAMQQRDTPEEPNLTAKLAVCILDSVAGHAEVFLGPAYEALPDRAAQIKHLALLWYVPGHYMCLVRNDPAGSKPELTYADFKGLLTKHGVVYIETTG